MTACQSFVGHGWLGAMPGRSMDGRKRADRQGQTRKSLAGWQMSFAAYERYARTAILQRYSCGIPQEYPLQIGQRILLWPRSISFILRREQRRRSDADSDGSDAFSDPPGESSSSSDGAAAAAAPAQSLYSALWRPCTESPKVFSEDQAEANHSRRLLT